MPTIKHIVLSGGGVCIFSFYTAIREAFKSKFCDFDHIESYYGTSAGSILSVMLAILPKTTWDHMDDFMLRRPWNKLFQFSVDKMLAAISEKGMFDAQIVREMFEPLFRAVDIPNEITMAEFHQITGKTLHLVTVELHSFALIDLTHSTHPHWKVLDAVYASMCLPVLCRPFHHENHLYGDGGIVSNFPLSLCMEHGAVAEEILGIRIHVPSMVTPEMSRPTLTTLLDYLFYLIRKMLQKIAIHEPNEKDMPYLIKIHVDWEMVSLYDIYKTTSSQEKRQALMDQGLADWKLFSSTLDTV
jgi:predicted acylesterase/phospholipase RssA